MDQDHFETTYQRIPYKERSDIRYKKIKKSIRCTPKLAKSLLTRLLSFLPIISWLPKYKIIQYLQKDVITGLIVGIMNVPQGMAYASLAQVPPVYGLYTAFFSGFFYIFFGTSKHISVGVFAVGSLMVGSVRLRLVPDSGKNVTGIENSSLIGDITNTAQVTEEITPAMVISALTFGVGIIQVIIGLLHLSFVTTYMTDQLISGYTTGSAFHVLASQLDKLFGVKIGHYEGAFVLYYTIRDVILLIPSAPVLAVLMSVVGIIYLVIGREWINPFVKRCCPIPIPHELILVVAATIFSYFIGAKKNYKVNVVDNIPRGFPAPSMPKLYLISHMLVDCIVIAVIAYMFVISMAKLFAKKHKYQIDDNQELYAIGFISILSSFFPTYPAGASLSRSSVCEMSGVKTQLYGIVSSGLLLVVILWLGPLLEPLPMCILACIIAVSLKGLFLQFGELPKLWRISKYDFAIWIVSCFGTLITDPTYGLCIALGFVLVTILIREQWPNVYLLHTDSKFESFKPSDIYPGLAPIGDNIRILKFNCPLHFANVAKFSKEISKIMTRSSNLSTEASPSTPIKESSLSRRSSIISQNMKLLHRLSITSTNAIFSIFPKSENQNITIPPSFKFPVVINIEKQESSYMEAITDSGLVSTNNGFDSAKNVDENMGKEILSGESVKRRSLTIIVNCSSISYVDTMGVEALIEAYIDGVKSGNRIIYADFTDQVLDTLECCQFYLKVPKESIFPSVRQAILSLNLKKELLTSTSVTTTTSVESETSASMLRRSSSF